MLGTDDRAAFEAQLRSETSAMLSLDVAAVEKLWQHYTLLSRWNAKLNLTTITSLSESVIRHYCESLFVAVQIPRSVSSIADVGSGAGFPGFPIAVVRPELSVSLIESHQRKAVFLCESSRAIPNVRVIAKRAELVQDRFDWVVSRAVRWQEVLSSGLAPEYGLLLSDADARAMDGLRAITKLPWGNDRVFAAGTHQSST